MSALIHFLARKVACGPPDPSVASDRNDDDQAVTNRTGSMSEPNRADRIGTAPSTTQNGEVLLHDGLAPSLVHASGATEKGDSMIESMKLLIAGPTCATKLPKGKPRLRSRGSSSCKP